MKVLKKVLFSILFPILLTVSVVTGGASAHADVPSTHGMFVFGGNQATYASHLPMFHSPHDYQLIFKLAFSGLPHSRTLQVYEAARKAGKNFFTIEPETFDLTTVIQGKRTSFTALLYDGHFERGGESLGKIKVTVQKIIFSSKLDGGHAPLPLQQYLVFGERGEYFAAHLIEGRPSFDAILSVNAPYRKLRPCRGTRLCDGSTTELISDQDLPLTLGSSGSAPLPVTSMKLGSAASGVAEVKQVLYLEEGDLSH